MRASSSRDTRCRPAATMLALCAAATGAVVIGVGSASAAAAAPACTSSALKISLNRHTGQNFTGHSVWAIRFKNIASGACSLRGYPGVSALSAAGKQIGPPASRDGGTKKTINIAVGKTARAYMSIVDPGFISKQQCGPVKAAHLRVFAPNTTVARLLPAGITVCSRHGGSLGIQPVRR